MKNEKQGRFRLLPEEYANIGYRLRKICDTFFSGNATLFATHCNIMPNNMRILLRGEHISAEYCIRILASMPEISAQWLLFNRGEMLLNTGNYTEELRRVQSEKDMLWERYDKAIETIGALKKEIDELRGDVERKKHA